MRDNPINKTEIGVISMAESWPVRSEYPDFDRWAVDNNIRYGRGYATFEELISNFDVSRMPEIAGAPMPYVGHIFFSRPSLNVNTGAGKAAYDSTVSDYGNSGYQNFSAMRANPMTAAWINDKYGQRLMYTLSAFSGSAWLPILTNRAMTYSVTDVSINPVEKGHTFFGHVLKYGFGNEDHKISNSVQIDFRNDYYGSVMKTMVLWLSYISIISREDSIKPTQACSRNAILDYCGSIYYLVTRSDMSTLVYWEKLTGVFPKTLPFSVYSYDDAMWTVDKYSFEFEYGMRSDPCDPAVLFDMNVLTTGTLSNATTAMQYGVMGNEKGSLKNRGPNLVVPGGFEGNFGRGNNFAAGPIVHIIKDGNTTEYRLEYTTAAPKG